MLFFILALLTQQAAPQKMSVGDVKQQANCAIAGVQGNVTVNCPSGTPPSTVALLNRQFAARLKDRDIRITELTTEVNEWKDRFDKLTARLEAPGMDYVLRRKAEELLKAGKLEEAGAVLDKILDSGEKEVDQIAKAHFDRASLYQLQFQPLQALPHYQKAFTYRPDNPDYGEAYGVLLYRQRDYVKAEVVLGQAMRISRELGRANPQTYLPNVAMALNNLGNLYSHTHRMKQADDAYTEALAAYSKLAEANPQAYLHYAADTLNNLGVLYNDMQRMKQADDAYTAALTIRRELAKVDSQAYLPDVAQTLNNLGNLYSDTQRIKKADDAYTEAITAYRELVRSNPQAYLPDLAATLNNLGILYRNTQRMKKADNAYGEALTIRRELAKVNPQAYLPDVAQTLTNLGLLYQAVGAGVERDIVCKQASTTFTELSISDPATFAPQIAKVCAPENPVTPH